MLLEEVGPPSTCDAGDPLRWRRTEGWWIGQRDYNAGNAADIIKKAAGGSRGVGQRGKRKRDNQQNISFIPFIIRSDSVAFRIPVQANLLVNSHSLCLRISNTH